MKPASFAYHAPKTLAEALDVLARVAPADGRVLAGGQTLLAAMAFRVAQPAHVVDINNVKELDYLRQEDDELVIGALVRHAAFHERVEQGSLGSLLTDVVKHIAHYPIRTRGTFCGSVANADPSSEWCLVSSTLDATMIAKSVRGARRIAARDYFQGVMTTALQPDELLAEVRLPTLPSNARYCFQEFSRRGGDFAIAMALAVFRQDGGKILEPRIGIGGVESRPRRIVEGEDVLNGQAPSAERFLAAAHATSRSVTPMTQESYQYSRDLVTTMTRRALDGATDRSHG